MLTLPPKLIYTDDEHEVDTGQYLINS